MFDFHMHSTVSFDGKSTAQEMARAAKEKGLREICFTDHIDRDVHLPETAMTFRTEDYNEAYENLHVPGLVIRKGIEFGMTPDNPEEFKKELQRRPFDFVLGSVHFVRQLNVYHQEFWEGKTVLEAETEFLEETLKCVSIHRDYDVLAHLNFLSKSPFNRSHKALQYKDHQEIIDEILKCLAINGKGLEINTSGMKRGVGFLPSRIFFQRFHELGGEIITVGSDAHEAQKVGDHVWDACEILRDIFGYVCTFEGRKPIFHKL